MIPACGPPSSLSPLNVTSAAPASTVWRAAGSDANQGGGGPGHHGHVASTSPLPRSTTTGGPSVASSPTDGVLDEAVDAVVAGVDLEHERDVGARALDGAAVVGDPRAVGRADVDQAGAGLLHHLGHAEATADLHALAAAHRHLSAGGQGGEHEEHGGRAVVDDHGVLGAAQPGEQLSDGALARAALAGRQVELHRLRPGVLVVGERCPPEVGVQQHARRR